VALVTDTIATVQSKTVLTKPPDFARQYTALPRALVNFTLQEEAISAKPINDDYELRLTITLDPTFAYRFVDFAANVVQDTAADWVNRGYLEVENGIRNLPALTRMRHAVALEKNLIEFTSEVEMWVARYISAQSMPRYILQAQDPRLPIQFSFNTANTADPAAAAGTVDCLFAFYEYEIEQAQYVAMHYAETVYDR